MEQNLKEAYRLFYMVKGHLNATPATVLGSAEGYYKRLWYSGSNGAPYMSMLKNLKMLGKNVS